MENALHRMQAMVADAHGDRQPAPRERLEAAGFLVGDRDPGRNRAWEGRFMVAEPLDAGDEYPTDDASGGAWCIVGDDLDALMRETCAFFDL